MDRDSLSRITPIAYIQKEFRKAKVAKFEKVMYRNGISESNFAIEGNWSLGTIIKNNCPNTKTKRHTKSHYYNNQKHGRTA